MTSLKLWIGWLCSADQNRPQVFGSFHELNSDEMVCLSKLILLNSSQQASSKVLSLVVNDVTIDEIFCASVT
jgi:hypothetical protein